MSEHGNLNNADANRESIVKSLKRWLTQTARECNCKDDEIAPIAYNYLADVMYLHKY